MHQLITTESVECHISHSFFYSIFFCFHSISQPPSTTLHPPTEIALLFVSALAHGSGFGSVTRWFQLLEVRMSDREGIRPPQRGDTLHTNASVLSTQGGASTRVAEMEGELPKNLCLLLVCVINYFVKL